MSQERKWGNGKDWNKAPRREGGWIRIWPMMSDKCSEEEILTDDSKSIKKMVQQVSVDFERIIVIC